MRPACSRSSARQSAWSVPRVTSSASAPSSRRRRVPISAAALLVNVRAQMRRGSSRSALDEVGDPLDQAERLAGARARHDEDGPERRLDGAELGGGRRRPRLDAGRRHDAGCGGHAGKIRHPRDSERAAAATGSATLLNAFTNRARGTAFCSREVLVPRASSDRDFRSGPRGRCPAVPSPAPGRPRPSRARRIFIAHSSSPSPIATSGQPSAARSARGVRRRTAPGDTRTRGGRCR